MALRVDWTEEQTKRALYLYFQLPFGQIDQRNSQIIALAAALGRTPSSVAMKLANFASLDPQITRTGRKGLSGASALDRETWNQFQADWTKLVVEVGSIEGGKLPTAGAAREMRMPFHAEAPGGPTTRQAEVAQRIGQDFFRRAVLANFNNACCVTGIAESKLLMASHISPWSSDVENRHNPKNGLCLSATFDRAFDRCLMTITQDLRVRLSNRLLRHDSPETRDFFAPYQGQSLRNPTHLMPDLALLAAHNERFIV